MSLLTDLVAHWKLDEASGAAIDAHSTHDLTETSGTIAAATGKIGGARDFELGDTEYFDIADNTDLSTGDIDFTFAGWVNLESTATTQSFIAKWQAGIDSREYALEYDVATDRFTFRVSSAGTAATEASVAADNFGSPSTATWYYVTAWHDSTANEIGIAVNAGTANTASHSGGVFDGTAPFRIGARAGVQQYFDGFLDSISFWKRVLTSDERAYLYNSGHGLPYEYFGDADPSALLDDLEGYWPLDEASGNALDAHGSLDLTETGGTIAADTGKVSGCRDFEAGDTEHFEIADNAALSGGDTDFTIAGWVKFESLAADAYLAGKAKLTGDQLEYIVLYSVSANRLGLYVSSAGTAASLVLLLANNLGAPSTGVWYFVVVKHDSVNNLISIQVNLGTPNTVAHSAGVFDGSAKFMLGNAELGVDAAGAYLDGMLDEWGFWRRILSDAELVALYNEGDGLGYGSFEGSGGGTFSSTASLVLGGVELSSTAEFDVPVYTGTASLSLGGVELAATAEHDAPSFTATSGLILGGVELSATATFAAATFTATAALTLGGVELSSTAEVDQPIFTATALLVLGGVEATSSAEFDQPVFAASADLTLGGVELSAAAIFAAEVYAGAASLTLGGVEFTAGAVFAMPTFTITADITLGGVELAASAEHDVPLFAAIAELVLGGLEFSAAVSGAVIQFYVQRAGHYVSGAVEHGEYQAGSLKGGSFVAGIVEQGTT